MDDNGYRFGVGVLVLASAIIGVLLIAFFGAVPKFWVERYRFTVNFPSAPNVGVDTPVRKNGVLIGRVAKIDLRKQRGGGVDLLLEVDREYELRVGETPRIKTGSLISGDSVIEFVEPNPKEILARFDGSAGSPRDQVLDEREFAAAQAVIGPQDFISSGQVVPDPLEAVGDLVGLANSLQRVAERLDSILSVAQDTIGDGELPIRDVTRSLKDTIDNINVAVGTVNRIGTQVERAQIPDLIAEALNEVPKLFQEAQGTLTQLQRTLRGFEEFSQKLEGISGEFEGIGESVKSAMKNADEAIANIAAITEPLSQQSDVLTGNLMRSLANIEALAADLRVFANRLNNSNGTIARLIDDPAMYGKINDTLDNVRLVSGNIELLSRRLHPIVEDVRVLTDKVARDPGQMGVRGILSPRPTGVGLK
ncbi:MAG: MlaD family protein [Planctomycetota bacterium]|jgi:phospholipid/cholesterol/gamma-HCH transport system substrate-binding protein